MLIVFNFSLNFFLIELAINNELKAKKSITDKNQMYTCDTEIVYQFGTTNMDSPCVEYSKYLPFINIQFFLAIFCPIILRPISSFTN